MKTDLTFWEHLDELRSVLLHCVIAVALAACVVFCFKDTVFSLVLAARESPLLPDLFTPSADIRLINTELTRQFIIHMMVSAYVGILLVAPYIIWQVYRFVLPALRANERRYSTPLVCTSYLMFMLGVCFSYFILFPLTYQFLATYQVDVQVENLISLQSYIDTLCFLCLAMGITFQMPVISWFLGRLGILSRQVMRRVRRHAFVVVLIVAAIITPTTDAFTLSIVALPMYLLYELSILLVPSKGRKTKDKPLRYEKR